MNGVNVDINALKKGEVKYESLIENIILTHNSQPWYINVRFSCQRSVTNRKRSMAVKYKDGIILGADSRTTTGAFIVNRVTDKLTQVHDKIWCCTYTEQRDNC